MDAIAAMESCRAMRYLKADPVPVELVRKVIHAATRASSPGNSQAWEFVVVTDAEQRRQLSEAIRTAAKPIIPPVPDGADRSRRLMMAGVHHLLDRLERVPVWIFVCGANVYPPAAPEPSFLSAALFPAAQNLIVAARSLGLGTVFTTFHALAEKRVREILALPDELHIGVTIPLGWPDRSFGGLKRRPLDDVLHWDRFGGRGPTA